MASDGAADDSKSPTVKVASLERALSVLKVFETADDALSLADIAAATGLYKSTILRLMLSFEEFGYIRRTEDGRYTLGPGVLRLGVKYRNQFRLDQAVNAALVRLVESGTESASFHVRDGEYRVCIARVDSHHPTLDRVKVGDMRPLALGAASKIIRAFDQAKADPTLEDVRRNHIALSFGELDPACWAIAAPVFTVSGRLLGAISLSGPKERFTPEAIAAMTAHLQAAARHLSDQAMLDSAIATSGPGRLLLMR